MKKFLLYILCTALLLCGCGEKQQTVTTTSTHTTDLPIPLKTEATTEAPVTSVVLPVDAETYFHRAVFVGDSIMEGIRQYVARARKNEPTLEDAKFVATTVGISLADLIGEKEQPLYYSYKGKEQSLGDILTSIEKVDRVFLLLGLNDLAGESDPSIDEILARYLRLIGDLQALLPEAEIIIMTNPPKVASGWLPPYIANRSLDNALIADFVNGLRNMCAENGIPYVDMHASLVDESGALPDEYCRDGYIHLNDAGAQIAVASLYAFAEKQGEIQ